MRTLLLYLALIGFSVLVPNPLTRALPLLLLAALAREQRAFALGLFLSAIGDGVFRMSFLAGLGFFLAAHLFYIATFARQFARRRIILTILLETAIAAYACFVVPKVGPLRVPVAAYAVVIAAMAGSAFLAEGPWTLPLGALLFVVSDSMLAYTKFVEKLAAVAALVSPLYFAGQFLLFESQTALRRAASSRGRHSSTS